MRLALAIGFVLCVISAPPLALMAREVMVGAAVARRYAIEPIPSNGDGYAEALTAQIGSHRVELVDDVTLAAEPFKTEESQRVEGLVRVMVDGRAVSTPVTAIVRYTARDANRYWGYVYLTKLLDREGPERLVVAQNLGARLRTVSVFPDGTIVEDTFTYPERCNPPVRALLIRYVMPSPSGFCSDVLQVWPTVFYPLLYPWLSGAVGIVLVVWGLWARNRRRIV